MKKLKPDKFTDYYFQYLLFCEEPVEDAIKRVEKEVKRQAKRVRRDKS